MTAATHTPTPWKQRENNPRNIASTLPDGSAHVVAVFASAADAAFAIRAVNCLEDALTALRGALVFMDTTPRPESRVIDAAFGTRRKAVVDAIAKAEGRTP